MKPAPTKRHKANAWVAERNWKNEMYREGRLLQQLLIEMARLARWGHARDNFKCRNVAHTHTHTHRYTHISPFSSGGLKEAHSIKTENQTTSWQRLPAEHAGCAASRQTHQISTIECNPQPTPKVGVAVGLKVGDGGNNKAALKSNEKKVKAPAPTTTKNEIKTGHWSTVSGQLWQLRARNSYAPIPSVPSSSPQHPIPFTQPTPASSKMEMPRHTKNHIESTSGNCNGINCVLTTRCPRQTENYGNCLWQLLWQI